ncbi:MAG TPA: cupin domain-containing protein [Candidatus Eremiobacteraceae bacterium]|nr:cupin domain-containing protein [Candidatus Eremiobacteraceae bacterium]
MHRGSLFAFVFVFAVAIIGFASSSAAMPNPNAPTIVQPSAVNWQPVKGMTGLMYAVLYGDPTKAGGQYATRYKVPDGFKFPPHSHPQIEQVTVLSGTLLVGLGDKVDPAKMLTLPAGSFVAIPAGLHHYAMAKGATVLELHGVGPYVMTMVK